MTATGRAWNSTLPARVVPLLRSPMERSAGLQRNRIKPAGNVVTLKPWSQRVTPSTIPPAVLKIVDKRDGHYCLLCGLHQERIDHHHRRIKGSGGDGRDHTECPCAILSACRSCHSKVHLQRRLVGEPRGFVIPRATLFPSLLPVVRRSPESGELSRLWPQCDGTWNTDDPNEEVA
jgi:hypothetical protein